LFILSGLLSVLQASLVDCFFLDPFSLLEDLIPASEVDVSRGEIL